MFILKKIFIKSALVGLAIISSLGSQMSHAMEQDPNQGNLKGNNSTASKKMGEFQVDNILSGIKAVGDGPYTPNLREAKLEALRDEKELIELTSFFKNKSRFDVEKFLAKVEQTANLSHRTKLEITRCKVEALRDEKDFSELMPFFFTKVPNFDFQTFYADVEQTADPMMKKKLGMFKLRIIAFKQEKEILESRSFLIIEELKEDLIPAIMIFDAFLSNQKDFPDDVKNVIIQNLLFLRLGNRFICPPSK